MRTPGSKDTRSCPETEIERRGKPGSIVSDNGTEFTCNALPAWCKETGIDWRFIAPVKPIQTADTSQTCQEAKSRVGDACAAPARTTHQPHAKRI
jgi:hypothetical protein